MDKIWDLIFLYPSLTLHHCFFFLSLSSQSSASSVFAPSWIIFCRIFILTNFTLLLFSCKHLISKSVKISVSATCTTVWEPDIRDENKNNSYFFLSLLTQISLSLQWTRFHFSSSFLHQDPNQFIRASALRVLSSIRVPIIVPIMMLAIKEAASDLSPYVRKTSAHAIQKLHR